MTKRFLGRFSQIYTLKTFYKLDRLVLLTWLVAMILCAIGCVELYSAAGGTWKPWAQKQLALVIIFGLIAFGINFISTNFFSDAAYYIYAVCLLLLFFAEFFGYSAMGAQRWLRIGFINFQPSEWMKLALIIVLSRYFEKQRYEEIGKIKTLIIPALMAAIPTLLILKQPNLGNAFILTVITVSIFFGTGIRVWKFIALTCIILACAPMVWKYGLYDYQKQRILTLLNPEVDLRGTGYNVMQSKIAIGSGAKYGKGLKSGSQSQLNFLPEKHTDFIGAVVAEEIGFLGVSFIILLYALLLFFGYCIVLSAKNHFGALLGIGIISMFFSHIAINLAMISGLIPVVGTPLLFLSYGGSNLSSSLIGLGLLTNIRSHHI